MKKLIAKFLGSASTETLPVNDSRTARDNPATILEGSDNAIRRQLVHMLLRDAMRLHGIPPLLIELQMLVVNSQSRGPGMYVRLVMPQWDQRLINYAYAFQTRLLADIIQFEPRASTWLHGISWQFSFQTSCPYQTMPERGFWTLPVSSEVSVLPAMPVTINSKQVLPSPSPSPPLSTLEIPDIPQNEFVITVALNDGDENEDVPTLESTVIKKGS